MDGGDAVAGGDGAAAAAVPFAHYARFVSVDRAERRFRFYELRLQATLWGGVALVWTWGRLGTPGRWRAIEYPDRGAADPDIERAVRRRLRRGYRLVDVR
jgi:predicted DNA-binding WGR domain protein